MLSAAILVGALRVKDSQWKWKKPIRSCITTWEGLDDGKQNSSDLFCHTLMHLGTSASSVIRVKSCWKSSWTGSNPKLKGLRYCWSAGWVHSQEKHHRTNPQSENPVWKVLSTSAESVSCLHIFQRSIWQGMACSLMGNHAEVQYQIQCRSSLRHWAPVWQGCKDS